MLTRTPRLIQPESLDKLEEIARAYAPPPRRASFRDRMVEFAEDADEIRAQLDAANERLRAVLAENTTLKSRVSDLERHIDVVNAHWEREWIKVNDSYQATSREYHALTARLDGAVDFMAQTRTAASAAARQDEPKVVTEQIPESESPAPAAEPAARSVDAEMAKLRDIFDLQPIEIVDIGVQVDPPAAALDGARLRPPPSALTAIPNNATAHQFTTIGRRPI